MKGLNLIKKWESIVTKRDIKTLLRKRWVIFGVCPLICLIGLSFVIWVGHLSTTHAVICLSCHAKQTNLPMWSPSQIHPKKVTCANCHAKPGQWFPMFFYADERVNDNCLSCHPKIAKSEMSEAHHMRITHKFHIEESKLLCIDCHRNIAHEKMEAGTNRPRKSTCVACHEDAVDGSPESCGKCHTRVPVKPS